MDDIKVIYLDYQGWVNLGISWFFGDTCLELRCNKSYPSAEAMQKMKNLHQ